MQTRKFVLPVWGTLSRLRVIAQTGKVRAPDTMSSRGGVRSSGRVVSEFRVVLPGGKSSSPLSFFLPTESIQEEAGEIVGKRDRAGVPPNELPDEVLVMAALVGDITAFDHLVRRYRGAVVRLAEAIVGPDLAEDVAQEALLTAFKALPTLETPSKFAAWLHVITRHKALRMSQREQALRDKQAELDRLLLERSTALSRPFLSNRAEPTAVREAIQRLPPDYRLVVTLRYFDQMPVKRIAEFLMLPLTTVKWRLHKGRHLLRQILEGGRHGKGTRNS